jgi:hypothetical protein
MALQTAPEAVHEIDDVRLTRLFRRLQIRLPAFHFGVEDAH